MGLWTRLTSIHLTLIGAARSDNALGLKGVNWHKAVGKYQATIQFQGVRHHLGWYDDPNLAYAAYCEAAKFYHGEFART